MNEGLNTALSILIIEDDHQIRRLLRTTLSANGYQVLEAATAIDGLRQVGLEHPDLLILDLGLPDMDGLEVARQLRIWTSMPIMVLSAKDHESDKIETLDAVVDDYLTKPFSAGELLARIRATLRHTESACHARHPVFSIGKLTVDMTYRKVYVNGTETHLSPIEYNLMMILIRNAGRAVARDHLLREVWGPTFAKRSHYLSVYMAYLRHKIEDDPAQPRYFVTEHGVGYRLKLE